MKFVAVSVVALAAVATVAVASFFAIIYWEQGSRETLANDDISPASSTKEGSLSTCRQSTIQYF